MATLADTLDAVALQLTNAAQSLRSGTTSLETDTFQRMTLLKAATDVLDAVSLPKDKFLLILPHISHLTAINVFIKWEAFQQIPSGDSASISYAELAAKVGGDVSLITRFGRALVAHGTLKQIDTSHIAHTAFSTLLATPNPIWALAQVAFNDHLPAMAAMPSYFAQFGLVEPTDRHHTPVAFANGKLGATIWEIVNSDPARLQTFMLAMGSAEEHMPALGAYDLSWVVAAAAADKAERAVVVDVGGGRGQALKEIYEATKGLERLKGRCVLGDLPEVVEALRTGGDEELKGVKLVAMDFHREQPIKGALVYYIRRCLHDYSDEEGVGILKQISGAMARDSKLLIVEILLADQPSPLQAAKDLMMMTISGKERTLENFREITGKAGLEITLVSQLPGGSAVIECALASYEAQMV